jgi:hypothetical protein
MVTRTSDGVYHTEPAEIGVNHNGDGGVIADASIGEIMSPEATRAWNDWWCATFQNHFEPEREALLSGVAKAVLELINEECAPLERRIEGLGLELAELRGAIDVLRGRENPDPTQILLAERDEKIEVLQDQVRTLELKLATVSGGLDVLRGRGIPGTLNIRGTFDELVSYSHLDVVALNGGSFVAIKDAPGLCPGPGWQLLASCGRRGARGERGLPGPRGPEAPRWRSVAFDASKNAFEVRLSDGSIGAVISLDCIFAGVDVDPSDYSIRVAMIDGSEWKFSLRGLFEQFFHEVKGH